jgi:tetratricopeptide (TPR) repeat protein
VVGEGPELFAVLQGLQWYQLIRLDLETARELGAQLLTLAEDAGEPANLMAAHAGQGLISLLSGEFAAARDHLEQASPRMDWGHCDFSYAFYPSVGAWALWVLGYADQALKWDREALALAQALSRPAPIANALHMTTVLHMYLREPRLPLERAEASNAIAIEYGTSCHTRVLRAVGRSPSRATWRRASWRCAVRPRNRRSRGLPRARDGLLISPKLAPGAKALGWGSTCSPKVLL